MKPLTPKERAKDLLLRREFHTTLEEKKAIDRYQGNKCAMCGQPASKFKNGLALDHNHTSGLVRGSLCHVCNRMLGKFRDNDDLLRAAAEYVTNPPAIKALGREIITATGRIGTKVRAKRLAAMKVTGVKSKKGSNGR